MSEIETSRELSRTEVARYLHEFADQLEATEGTANSNANELDARETRDTQDPAAETTGQQNPIEGTNQRRSDRRDADTGENDSDRPSNAGKVTFLVGNDSATINPPERLTFDISVDSDSAVMTSATRRSVTFQMEWDVTEVDEDDALRIE